MKKTFIRTVHQNGGVECSWYDKNGRRYRRELSFLIHQDLDARQTDNIYGFMGYAQQHRFNIIDDYVGEHPKRITCE